MHTDRIGSWSRGGVCGGVCGAPIHSQYDRMAICLHVKDPLLPHMRSSPPGKRLLHVSHSGVLSIYALLREVHAQNGRALRSLLSFHLCPWNVISHWKTLPTMCTCAIVSSHQLIGKSAGVPFHSAHAQALFDGGHKSIEHRECSDCYSSLISKVRQTRWRLIVVTEDYTLLVPTAAISVLQETPCSSFFTHSTQVEAQQFSHTAAGVRTWELHCSYSYSGKLASVFLFDNTEPSGNARMVSLPRL